MKFKKRQVAIGCLIGGYILGQHATIYNLRKNIIQNAISTLRIINYHQKIIARVEQLYPDLNLDEEIHQIHVDYAFQNVVDNPFEKDF